MATMREIRRQRYWEQKYLDPQWDDDIHIGIFHSNMHDFCAFQRALRANTDELIDTIVKFVSSARARQELRMVDFGCGAGDFLVRFAQTEPEAYCFGFDLAHTAIAIAADRARRACVTDRITFHVGGVPALGEVGLVQHSMDVVVCRDMFYLLNRREQSWFLQHCRELLHGKGLLYIADLAVEATSLADISRDLLARQFGGTPITWDKPTHGRSRSFSIERQAGDHGFSLVESPHVDESAVAQSYAAASDAAKKPASKVAYTKLAEIAAVDETGSSKLPYVRFCFRPE